MAFPVIVPRESEEMELCQVIQWHVKKGQWVKQGDILCEVDTGKASFDLEAPSEGLVLDIFYHENQEAPLLTPIAVIGEKGESYDQFKPSAASGPDVVEHETAEVNVVEHQMQKTYLTVKRSDDKLVDPQGRWRRPVSPRARRFAVRNGIPLDRIQGSGPGGAVVERDVRSWLRNLHAS